MSDCAVLEFYTRGSRVLPLGRGPARTLMQLLGGPLGRSRPLGGGAPARSAVQANTAPDALRPRCAAPAVQTQAEIEEQQERIKKRRRESAQRSRARKNSYMKTLEVGRRVGLRGGRVAGRHRGHLWRRLGGAARVLWGPAGPPVLGYGSQGCCTVEASYHGSQSVRGYPRCPSAPLPAAHPTLLRPGRPWDSGRWRTRRSRWRMSGCAWS